MHLAHSQFLHAEYENKMDLVINKINKDFGWLGSQPNPSIPLPVALNFSLPLNKKDREWGSLGGAAVWRLPLAQGAILETRDRIPRRAPGAWSLLLPLPVSLPLSFSLSVTIINK